MTTILSTTAVVALTILQAPTAPKPLDKQIEADAYAVYASVLASSARSKPSIVLMRETQGPPPYSCSKFISGLSGEWQEVAQDFRNKNARTWLLQPAVSLGVEYRLISKAEIQADDARIAKQNPGRRSNAPAPGSIDFIAVSAVGFNATRTKALVYVRMRMEDSVNLLIRSGRGWVRDPKALTCGGIA